MDIDALIDKYMIDEITRMEQLKNSAQKAKQRKIEQRGDSPTQRLNFKHRNDLKKDTVKHAEKRVDYYEKELDTREKEKLKAQKERERGPGILRRLVGRS